MSSQHLSIYFVCVCVHAHVNGCTGSLHVCVCVCEGHWTVSGVIPSRLLSVLVFEAVALTGLKIHCPFLYARQAVQLAPELCLDLPPQCWDYKHRTTHCHFLCSF